MFLALSAVFINESPPHYPVGAIHNISIIAANGSGSVGGPRFAPPPSAHISAQNDADLYLYTIQYTVYSKVGEVVSNNYKMRGVFRILL